MKLEVLSSKSIDVNWKAPENGQNLNYYVGYTSALTTAKTEAPTVSTNMTLTGLHPYEEYTISVQAGNRAGLSVPVTGTARTFGGSEYMIIVISVLITVCPSSKRDLQ